MNCKDILVAQLNACHNHDTWFVSLQSALRGLTAEQASEKTKNSANSIHEIVNHLIYYNERYLNRFNGITNPKGVESNDDTFTENAHRSWQSTVETMDNIMSEWIISVKDSQEDRLQQWAADLTHLTIHTTYHIGQIVQIRKEQGSWNPSNGVH